MPSLAQLESFKDSFLTIGQEDAIRKAQGKPAEGPALPENEGLDTNDLAPLPVFTPPAAAPEQQAEAAPEAEASPEEFFDFDDLTGGMPEEAPTPEEVLAEATAEAPPEAAPPPEPEAPPEPETPPETAPQPEPEASPIESPAEEAPAEETPPEESPAAPQVAETPEAAPPEAGATAPGDDFDFPDFDMPNSGDTAPAPGPEPEMPAEAGEPAPQEEAAPPEAPGIPDINLTSNDTSADASSNDFLSADEAFDNFTFDNMEEPAATEAGEEAAFNEDLFPEEAASVDEINIEEGDFIKLQQTLDSYPLNLRIACEEIIAEQTVLPDQLASLINLLIRGAPAEEAASLAGRILGEHIPVVSVTGLEFEASQQTFEYKFKHLYLPRIGIGFLAAIVIGFLTLIVYQYVYIPLHSDSIYQSGLEIIPAGEYSLANERFNEAFALRQNKNWFYKYAEAFRDSRQYLLAEEKYDQLLGWYPNDKKAALDYAAMETNYLRNYDKANTILRQNLLSNSPDDPDGLIASGDNYLSWAMLDSSYYEDARLEYARVLMTGWTPPVIERMLYYFIRTDNLAEVINLQTYFSATSGNPISSDALIEMSAYLLNKRLQADLNEDLTLIPDAWTERIQNTRDLLLRAVSAAPDQGEPYYNLALYYNEYGSQTDEKDTLARAVQNYRNENPDIKVGIPPYKLDEKQNALNRINAEKRYADVLVASSEFFTAESQLSSAASLYQNAIQRDLLKDGPELGEIWASLGDLEYYVKNDNMERAIEYYNRAEQSGYSTPETKYKTGAAYYRIEDWQNALTKFHEAYTQSKERGTNRKALYALGNTAYLRGDDYAAQAYYELLLKILEPDLNRITTASANDRSDYMQTAERVMITRNNLGVALENLADRTGNPALRQRARGYYVQSSDAWDVISRNPQTMVRSGVGDPSSPGTNLAGLNLQASLYPAGNYEKQIYMRIDREMEQDSPWTNLATPAAGIVGN
ncbi:MAG: tetratricopeptide repeat protein [Spirochaetaceae bacterium]|jgi:tetratricopeptide (TPR) repeat protein|nr:tetratricopeptide repeat protein [Spirochaetaceae bacterium]